MPIEIREVLMSRDEVIAALARMGPDGSLRVCNIPAGARALEMDTWGRLTRGGRIRIALYSIEVPGPETTISVHVGADTDKQVAIPAGGAYPELDGARSVDELNISVRTSNNLKLHGIYHLRSLVELSAVQLLKLDNFGRNSLAQVERALGELGMKLWGR